MSVPTVKLKKNLRRSILRGEPWIYAQAIHQPQRHEGTTCLCKVVDSAGHFCCWALYAPDSPLALRVLSLEKKPPSWQYYENLLQQAKALRAGIDHNETNCYRLINGEGDFLPGVICDVYAEVAVLQFDGSSAYYFWDRGQIAEWILKNTPCTSVYYKPRHDMEALPETWGKDPKEFVLVRENACQYYVDVINGQKTGFFLDQRENRDYVQTLTAGKTVLNLFSYTGGFSVSAGKGGATQVTSVDKSQGALDLAQKNWQLNELLAANHVIQCADIFDFTDQPSKSYDLVICDPPSLAKAEKHKEQAQDKYIEIFTRSASMVKDNGHLILSSCSSHINFDDFNEIVTSVLSKIRKRGRVLRLSGQGADHPYPQAYPQLRYLKFVHMQLS